MITTLYLLIALSGDVSGDVIKVYPNKADCEFAAKEVNRVLKGTGKVECKVVDTLNNQTPIHHTKHFF